MFITNLQFCNRLSNLSIFLKPINFNTKIINGSTKSITRTFQYRNYVNNTNCVFSKFRILNNRGGSLILKRFSSTASGNAAQKVKIKKSDLRRLLSLAKSEKLVIIGMSSLLNLLFLSCCCFNCIPRFNNWVIRARLLKNVDVSIEVKWVLSYLFW